MGAAPLSERVFTALDGRRGTERYAACQLKTDWLAESAWFGATTRNSGPGVSEARRRRTTL